jgi:hypothetical protein
MIKQIPKSAYYIIIMGVFALIYFGKLDISVEFLGNIIQFISK